MTFTWGYYGQSLQLTINYTKPSETGGMASGCSTSYWMSLDKGYNHAHNACVKAAKRDFHLPDLHLLPVDPVPVEAPKTFDGMTKGQWLIVVLFWGCCLPLMIVGVIELYPHIMQWAHNAAVWMVEGLNSWGLNVHIVERRI